MMRDMHNNVDIVRSISPVAVGTTGTGQTGVVVDRRGYDSVEFVFSYGTITGTTGVTLTPTVLEGDATGSMTSVADTDLLGTEAAAGLAGVTSRVSGASKNVTKRLGYKGGARYVQAKIVSTGTAATLVSADVILGRPHTAPVAT